MRMCDIDKPANAVFTATEKQQCQVLSRFRLAIMADLLWLWTISSGPQNCFRVSSVKVILVAKAYLWDSVSELRKLCEALDSKWLDTYLQRVRLHQPLICLIDVIVSNASNYLKSTVCWWRFSALLQSICLQLGSKINHQVLSESQLYAL